MFNRENHRPEQQRVHNGLSDGNRPSTAIGRMGYMSHYYDTQARNPDLSVQSSGDRGLGSSENRTTYQTGNSLRRNLPSERLNPDSPRQSAQTERLNPGPPRQSAQTYQPSAMAR